MAGLIAAAATGHGVMKCQINASAQWEREGGRATSGSRNPRADSVRNSGAASSGNLSRREYRISCSVQNGASESVVRAVSAAEGKRGASRLAEFDVG
jgi:hypothetical protein